MSRPLSHSKNPLVPLSPPPPSFPCFASHFHQTFQPSQYAISHAHTHTHTQISRALFWNALHQRIISPFVHQKLSLHVSLRWPPRLSQRTHSFRQMKTITHRLEQHRWRPRQASFTHISRGADIDCKLNPTDRSRTNYERAREYRKSMVARCGPRVVRRGCRDGDVLPVW
jgi:hypothetical protein